MRNANPWKTFGASSKELSKHQDSRVYRESKGKQGNKWSRCLGTGSPASPSLDNQEFQYPTLQHNTLHLQTLRQKIHLLSSYPYKTSRP